MNNSSIVAIQHTIVNLAMVYEITEIVPHSGYYSFEIKILNSKKLRVFKDAKIDYPHFNDLSHMMWFEKEEGTLWHFLLKCKHLPEKVISLTPITYEKTVALRNRIVKEWQHAIDSPGVIQELDTD